MFISVKGEFTLIEPLKYYVANHGGPIVKLFLCRSVDGISHLLRHFLASFDF